MILDAIATTGTSGTASQDRQGIADDFDTFLSLLTTQLQNQNPLDPLDTNQFTEQLVQFSAVEQQIKSNENLEDIVAVSRATAAANSIGFVGKNVTVQSAQTQLNDGSASWYYTPTQESDDALFTIRDSAGAIIWQDTRGITAQRSTFQWDGRNNAGVPVANGAYNLTIEARDADREAIDIPIEVDAVIDGIDFNGDEPLLVVGDIKLPLSDVRTVSTP